MNETVSRNDHLIIETPEQILLELRLAGIGSRFLAIALDTLIQIGGVVVITFLLTRVHPSHLGATRPKGVWVAAGLVLVYFVIIFGYFAVFEAVWNGQTPGKRWLRLRVIEVSGRPITAYDSIARNLVRIVDSIPGFYAVGIICAVLNAQSRRLGDYVAGTVVIRESQALWESGTGFLDAAAGEGSTLPGLSTLRLSTDEFRIIEAFLARRRQLPAGIRSQIATKVANRIRNTLGLPASDAIASESLLEQVAARFRDQARLREDKKS